MTEPQRLSPRDVLVDESLQPRAGELDRNHVEALKTSPESWPPLRVATDGQDYLLIDGFHRLAAALSLGLPTVPIEIVSLPEDGDLLGLAFDLNARHGRPLSLSDRKAFARQLLRRKPRPSDREIGRRCGLSHATVAALRREPDKRSARRQREPGEMPAENAMARVAALVKPQGGQRRIASYLQRLAVALNDQYELGAWQTAEGGASACRAVLGERDATELAWELGPAALNVVAVARRLGYDPSARKD